MPATMTMSRYFRKSKELPADEILIPTGNAQEAISPPDAKKSEAHTIQELLKATKGGTDTTALRERRMSAGTIDPLKEKVRRLTPEAQAINDLIKESASDGAQNVIQKRRKSMDGSTPIPKNTNVKRSSVARDSVKSKGIQFADQELESTQKKPMSSEAEDINRRITEDRRVRRMSKELEESEQAAMKKLHALNTAVSEAEAEAEAKAEQQYANLGAAAVRGAAKAAAKAAGGRFMSKEEWENMQGRLAELEDEIAVLKEERVKSRSIFDSIAQRFKRGEGSSPSSPTKQSGTPSFKRSASFEDETSGRSFVKRMLDRSGDSFVLRLTRNSSGNSSPFGLRRSNSRSKLGSQNGEPSDLVLNNIVSAAA